PIINQDMRIGMVIQTIAKTTATLLAFVMGHPMRPGDGLELALSMAFVTLSFSELLRAYTSRSELYSLFKIGVFSNKYMQYAVFTSIALLMLVVYLPFLQSIFDTTALDITPWLYMALLIPLPAMLDELTKLYLRRHHQREWQAQG
ncbi:MAG: cation transporting ATPase C-terminal domain-containing protein, partial [Chloroflexi bacterium]|nr:cation transporting ATPase C-terminal domain-containing protein [Chloroflexota bacterium]